MLLHSTTHCFTVLQIAALMKDKAALEARVTLAAAVAPAEVYKHIDTLPKYCCKGCG